MTLGVVIGRFQIDDLHEAHKQLMRYVTSHCEDLLILVGYSEALEFRPNASNPMSIKLRTRMLENQYGRATIMAVQDKRDDRKWSESVDALITLHRNNMNIQTDPVIIFGGRDSFLPHYQGQFPVWEVPEGYMEQFCTGMENCSATKRREEIKNLKPLTSPSFRKGVIHGITNLPPAVFPVVDIAVITLDKTRNKWMLLMGQRKEDEYWRLPGGFVDATDSSLEAAARRELDEETKIYLPLTDFKYVSSSVIDDWRFKDRDSIMTSLFVTEVGFSTIAHAGDDLHEVTWMPLFHPGAGKGTAPEHCFLVTEVQRYVRHHYSIGDSNVQR